MQPVLFTIANQPISSFGLFLILSLLSALFITWRIARVYEIDEEKVIDIALLSFAGGLIFSRLYFIAFHLNQFDSLTKVIFLNKYPGLSFWGGIFGGLIALKLVSIRTKLIFWQIMDFAAPAVFLGLVFGNIGCLLGSCQYGVVSNLPFAINQIGIIGKRFPIQAVESLVFLIGFVILWKKAVRFHFNGQIASIGLILLGIIKFVFEFYRGEVHKIWGFQTGLFWPIVVIIVGVTAYYFKAKRSIVADLLFAVSFLYSQKTRVIVFSKLTKNWFNFFVGLKVGFAKRTRNLLRFLNVKTNPPKFHQ